MSVSGADPQRSFIAVRNLLGLPHVVEVTMGHQDRGRAQIVFGNHPVDICCGILTRVDDHALSPCAGADEVTIGTQRSGGESCDEHAREVLRVSGAACVGRCPAVVQPTETHPHDYDGRP